MAWRCAWTAAWRWGLPLAADGVAAQLPAAVDEQLGAATLASLDALWLSPSTLPVASQRALREQLAAALQRDPQGLGALHWQLDFRDAGQRGLGANALALPGGQVIVTDALAELLADRPELMLGVLGHELGHLRHRHGTRMAVRATLLAGTAGLLLGDVSSLLALLPTALAEAAYSRDFEGQADGEAARLLRANGVAPQVMAELFDRLRHARPDGTGSLLPMAFSSHPGDAERVRRMAEVR